jgi:hypothetical protein
MRAEEGLGENVQDVFGRGEAKARVKRELSGVRWVVWGW